jgi:hypothetical protein
LYDSFLDFPAFRYALKKFSIERNAVSLTIVCYDEFPLPSVLPPSVVIEVQVTRKDYYRAQRKPTLRFAVADEQVKLSVNTPVFAPLLPSPPRRKIVPL